MKSKVWLVLLLLCVLPLASPSLAIGQGVNTESGVDLWQPLAYPSDPTSDIEWSAGASGVADIETAFNNARTVENSQLGTSVPSLSMPSQAEWDAKSDSEKAFWLVNRERIDRGVHPLDGVESNVTSVAQYYADYLLDNDAWGHSADGNDPWKRLDNNAAIHACRDSLSVAENLAVFVTSGSSIDLPVERSVYMWLYDDASSDWGHRHAVLWYPYNDNAGIAGQEGFMGIGRASGGPYQGPFSQQWPFAELIVMNMFDPCATWDYGGTEAELGDLPDALSFTYSIPDQILLPPNQRLTPTNSGSSETLTWSLGQSGSWFDLNPTQGATPNAFQITPGSFDTGSVATLTGSVTITVTDPPGAGNSPQTVNLTLYVVDTPFEHVYLPFVVK